MKRSLSDPRGALAPVTRLHAALCMGTLTLGLCVEPSVLLSVSMSTVALGTPAAATTISFDDATESGIKVTVDGKACPPEGPTHCFASAESATFFSAEIPGITVPPVASRVSSVLIMEPPKGAEKNGETPFALSDVMTIRIAGSAERGINITIDFESDPNAAIPSGGSGAPEITEDGTFQNITSQFLKTAGGTFPNGTFPGDFNIEMRSDIAAVPEPATLGLLGVGLVALGLMALRKA